MHDNNAWWHSLLFNDGSHFREKVAHVLCHQLRHLPVYRTFCESMHRSGLSTINPEDYCQPLSNTLSPPSTEPSASSSATPPATLPDPDEIPLMPVQAFRDVRILADYVREPETLFHSSGTSGSVKSTHHVADLSLYLRSCREGFARFYDPREWSILAWLPGYAENPHSSLLTMIGHFIEQDPTGLSRFLPLESPPIQRDFQAIADQGRRVMLFGAAFGLLDMLEGLSDEQEAGRSTPHHPTGSLEPSDSHPSTSSQGPSASDPSTPLIHLPSGSVVVETGGMKTRRRERTRQELHRELAAGFGLPESSIHSEYGMAETSSQAWDTGSGRYRTPPWMHVTIRDYANPMRVLPAGREGLIGIVDLANVHSLAFLLTQDRGVAWPDGSFQVLGRKRHAPLRGCNFLMEPDTPNPTQ